MVRLVVSVLLVFAAMLATSCFSHEELTVGENCGIYENPPDSLRYKPVYDQPVVLAPDQGALFYSNEEPEVRWELPEGLISTEIQELRLAWPFQCQDYGEFHRLGYSSFGYGNQFLHQMSFADTMDDTTYVVYRLRSSGPDGYSAWTTARSFSVVPISSLQKRSILVTYDFTIQTNETNQEYYSDVVVFENYRLATIAQENQLELDEIKVIRPTRCSVKFNSLTAEGQIPFERITVGYEEEVNPLEEVYPFEPLSQVAPGSYEYEEIFGTFPYGGGHLNLTEDLKKYDLKLAYVLTDVPGKTHTLTVTMGYEVYF